MKMRINVFLIFVTAVTAIAGFLYGYDTGIISGALIPIKDEFHLNYPMQEIVTSAILLGAIIGALVCGQAIERIGRRWTIAGLACIYTTGAILCALAPSALLLGLARIFLGFAVGGSSQTIPVYVAELAPPKHRGHFVTTFNVAIGLGILTANLVATFYSHSLTWRWMIGGACMPAAVLLLCSLTLPESPRWLVGQAKTSEARQQLLKVRSDEAGIDEEIREIEDITEKENATPSRGWSGLAQPWVRPAVVAALGVATFTQITGIEMMVYYTPTMLTDPRVGFEHASAMHVSLGLAVVYLVMTAIGLSIVDRVGRRTLTLAMLPGAAISLIALGTLLHFGLAHGRTAWLIPACLLSYMFFSAGGIQVVGWLTGSEMYPLSVRGAGSSAQAATVWGTNLLVTGTALSMVEALGTGGLMWVYGAMNVLAFWFVYRLVPETAGRSLEDIERSLRAGDFLPESRSARPAPKMETA